MSHGFNSLSRWRERAGERVAGLSITLSPCPSVRLRLIPRLARDRTAGASCALRAGPINGRGEQIAKSVQDASSFRRHVFGLSVRNSNPPALAGGCLVCSASALAGVFHHYPRLNSPVTASAMRAANSLAITCPFAASEPRALDNTPEGGTQSGFGGYTS